MKQFALFLIACLGLLGCVSDPLMTGKPQDWQRKQAADLRAAWGEPTRIISATNGDQIWEYRKSSDALIPKGENTSLNFGGIGSSFGGSGGFSSEKRPEDRISRVETLCRFKVRNGKIKSWHASRMVDGNVVWEDH